MQGNLNIMQILFFKISKFYFILPEDKNAIEKFQIANILSLALKKQIASGK